MTYLGAASIQSFLTVSGVGSDALGQNSASPALTPEAPDLLGQFPDKDLVDHLVDTFRKTGPLDHFPYAPIALDSNYDSLSRILELRSQVAVGIYLLSATADIPPVSQAFLCLVAMACVLTLQALPLDSQAYVAEYGDALQLRRQFYALARSALTRSELEETPDLTRIEAIVMMGLVRLSLEYTYGRVNRRTVSQE